MRCLWYMFRYIRSCDVPTFTRHFLKIICLGGCYKAAESCRNHCPTAAPPPFFHVWSNPHFKFPCRNHYQAVILGVQKRIIWEIRPNLDLLDGFNPYFMGSFDGKNPWFLRTLEWQPLPSPKAPKMPRIAPSLQRGFNKPGLWQTRILGAKNVQRWQEFGITPPMVWDMLGQPGVSGQKVIDR